MLYPFCPPSNLIRRPFQIIASLVPPSPFFPPPAGLDVQALSAMPLPSGIFCVDCGIIHGITTTWRRSRSPLRDTHGWWFRYSVYHICDCLGGSNDGCKRCWREDDLEGGRIAPADLGVSGLIHTSRTHKGRTQSLSPSSAAHVNDWRLKSGTVWKPVYLDPNRPDHPDHPIAPTIINPD